MGTFNEEEDENFTPKNSNINNEERIRKFLNSIHGDSQNESSVNQKSKRKIIDVAFNLGIDSFIKSFPKITKSDLYDKLITDLFNHYTKNKFDDINEIDIENIIHVIKYYEGDEEYEKCHELTEIYKNEKFF
jgi:hypothetical protein